MLAKLQAQLVSIVPFSFSTTFRDYISIYQKYFKIKSYASSEYLYFEKIFITLLSCRTDYFYKPEWFYLLSLLLFGCRASEFKSLIVAKGAVDFHVYIQSLKGSESRDLKFSCSSPLLKMYYDIYTTPTIRVSYKAFYRSLLKANPNFYKRFPSGHMHMTHLFRHFLSQTLRYVLKIKKKDISKFFGWLNDSTIENYIDRALWSNTEVLFNHE